MLRAGFLLFFCFAMLLIAPAVMAGDPQVASRPVLRLPFEQSTSEALQFEQPQLRAQCHLSGADVERIERDTSDPCLVSEFVPGAVCFARLGESPMSADSFDRPHDWYRHCGT